PTIIAGPVQIIAESVRFNSTANPADGSVRHQLMLNLTASIEPSANVLGIVPTVTIENAINQNDRSIRQDTRSRGLSDLQTGPVVQLTVPLDYQPRTERIKQLRG